MDKTFRLRPNLFEELHWPKIKRDTVLGCVGVAACGWAWFQFESWLFPAIGLVVVAERVFELTGVPGSKRAIRDVSVTVGEQGLVMNAKHRNLELVYPWSSLQATTKKDSKGDVTSIVVNDESSRRSRIELEGFEAMNELDELIRRKKDEL